MQEIITCDANEQAKVMLLQEIVDLAMHVYDLRDVVESVHTFSDKPIIRLTEKGMKALCPQHDKGKWERPYSGPHAWERSLYFDLGSVKFLATETYGTREEPPKPEED